MMKPVLIVLLLLLIVSSVRATVDGSQVEQVLQARGLAGSTPASAIQAPPGVEVDEYLQSNLKDGQELVRFRQWEERADGKPLQVQLLKYPTGQQTVAYWLMQPSGTGCILFGSR